MRIKHFAAIAAAVCLINALAGCGNEIEQNTNLEIPPEEEIVTAIEEDSFDTQADTDGEEEASVPTYEEVQITAASVAYTEFSKTYNAESGVVSGKAEVSDEREGFKGEGYVTGITQQSDWEISFDLPSDQYYNISITVASDKAVKNGIGVNGVKISEFTTSGTGEFETFTFKNIRLGEGVSKVCIIPEDGEIDVDYVDADASDEISKLSFTLKNPTLSNADSGYNAKALYKYLCDSFGSAVILGQYDTIGTTYETQLIYRTTGKNPAIRFGDFMQATGGEEYADSMTAEIEAARQWHESGGIVGYMWNWCAPGQSGDSDSIYAENADFDLSKAVTDEAIAQMSLAEIKSLQKEGKVSEECVALIEDIDKVSAYLQTLRDEGIAVLWRPLQEASNGYYWWGKDEDSYKWLWKLLYERQTKYHGLDNLVWVWSAQNAGWYVGDSCCDVLSVDVYSDSGSKSGQVNFLLHLQSISSNKPIAMSECGSLPQIQSIADEKAMWSYIGQWGAGFLVNEDGKLEEQYNTEADLIAMYNNNLTVTREKLPDFITLANEIKQQEEAQKEEAQKSDSDSSAAQEDTESSQSEESQASASKKS